MVGMTGVEILNTIYEYDSLIHPMWFVSFLMATLIIGILGICTIDYDKVQTILKILVTFTIIGTFVCVLGSTVKTNEIADTKYQVIISEDVNFSEFMERYEILDQEGKIYTVRERE